MRWIQPPNILVLLAMYLLVTVSISAQTTNTAPKGRILLVSNASGSWQIYRSNPDGSHMVQLTNLANTFFESWTPTYSPDGKKIAFGYGVVDQNGNGPLDVYVMDADGGNITQLTHDGISQIPRWSPDGTHLVFARSADTGVNVITTMRADGTHAHALTSKFWDSFGGIYTPDGKQIVFYSQQGGFVSTVWIMHTDGSHQRRLTAAALEAFPWDVSPSGDRIAIFSHNNTSLPTSIYTLDTNGQHLRRLTAAHNGFPTYSPDGGSLAFASNRNSQDGSLDLYTMRIDGSHVKKIATDLTVGGCADGNCLTPNWGPKK